MVRTSVDVTSDESMMAMPIAKEDDVAAVLPGGSRKTKSCASSGFVTFSEIESVILRQIYPGMSELGIALVERWENMSTAEKAQYVEMASAQVQRQDWEAMMISCGKATETGDVNEEEEAARTTRTAFLIFSNREGEKLLESYPRMSGLEIAVAQKWERISDEEKELYECMAQIDDCY